MFRVEHVWFDGLTPEEKQEYQYQKERDFLRITDDMGTRLYCSGYEPEDVSFSRDLSWIKNELHNAFDAGVKHEQEDGG